MSTSGTILYISASYRAAIPITYCGIPSQILLPPSSTLTRSGYFATTPFLPSFVTSTSETFMTILPKHIADPQTQKFVAGLPEISCENHKLRVPQNTPLKETRCSVLGGSSPSLTKAIWGQKRVERRGINSRIVKMVPYGKTKRQEYNGQGNYLHKFGIKMAHH